MISQAMRRYQRRNAIYPTSNEAIALRAFSSNHSQSEDSIAETGGRRLSVQKFQERKIDLDVISKQIKELSAASAA